MRLFANLLAGHLLILFMGGGLVVILGIAALGPLTLIVAIVFFIFEVDPDRRAPGLHLFDLDRYLPR